MSIKEKLANAEKESCFTHLYTDQEWEIKKIKSLIGAEIEFARISLGQNQKDFAKFMGVTQGMVSRWESGTYNFTIETLSNIAFKLGRSVESFFTSKQLQYDDAGVEKILNEVPSGEMYKQLAKRVKRTPKRKAIIPAGGIFSNNIDNTEVGIIA